MSPQFTSMFTFKMKSWEVKSQSKDSKLILTATWHGSMFAVLLDYVSSELSM